MVEQRMQILNKAVLRRNNLCLRSYMSGLGSDIIVHIPASIATPL